MNETILYEAPLLRGRFIVFNERPSIDFLKVKQTHSNIVVSEDQCNEDMIADGIYGKSAIPKAILTADCLPIVLLGKDEHVVIHAGWKGLALKILLNEHVKMIQPLYAFIGPHIRVQSYEVQNDFISNFPENNDAFLKQDNKTFLDLSSIATKQLVAAYPSIIIEDCKICTYSNENYHSYRRDQTQKRNWNLYFPQ